MFSRVSPGHAWRRLAGRFLGVEITVEGNSMAPAFSPGDRAVVDPAGYKKRDPSRFDVVLARPANNDREDLKRIVGLPGELVELREGSLRIDGAQVAEPHLDAGMPADWLFAWAPRAADRETPGEYVLLGDNRGASTDSRAYGVVPRDRITGPVVRRLPPDHPGP